MTANRLILICFVAAVLAAPLTAQKVYIDFDETADFSQYKTFAFRESPEDLRDTNQLGHTRVQNAIKRQLETAPSPGELVQQDPDLWVTYHTAEKEELRVDHDSLGYGYGSGWYGSGWRRGGYYGGYGGYGGSYSTTVSTYTKGTLVIDIWDAKKEQMVWRGMATATVSENPDKQEKTLEKALDKMSKQYQKQQKKNAKVLAKG